MSAVPSLVGHYLQHIAAPATTAAYNHLAERIIANGQELPPMPSLGVKVDSCGQTMAQIDLVAIALSLGQQRAVAEAGAPRGDNNGRRAQGGVSRPTESVGDELERIRQVGRDLTEALDRVHPDPQGR